MAEADIVGRQRKPGSVRFGDMRRNSLVHPGDILRAPADALRGIQPVLDLHLLRRVQGQHHQTAYSGGRLGALVPEGLLVADGSQQTPVDSDLVRRLAEQGLVSWQVRLDAPGEGSNIRVIEFFDVTVMPVHQLLEPAVFFDFREKIIDRRCQTVVIAVIESPAQLPRFPELEGNA